VRRAATFLVLLAASPGLHAERAETPFLVFREPDAQALKEIKDLITEKRLGGRNPDTRRASRDRLVAIGPWCVPSLTAALKKETTRIKLNAVLALAGIRDPRALPALAEAAAKDGDISVRRAATLSIALFEHEEDLQTLVELLKKPRAEWRSIAPALARLRARPAGPVLRAASAKMPDDENDRAAIVLASAIAGPEPPAPALLEDRKEIVQQAAAAGLAVRPLPPQRAGEILAALARSKIGKDARVLAIHALGAIRPRPAEAETALLDLACKDGRDDERIAAALELSGTAEEFGSLWRAYRKLENRNDSVVAALLLALARTRDEKAQETLLDLTKSGSDFVKFYAGAALLYVYGPERLSDDQRARIVQVEKLADLAQQLYDKSDAVRKKALEEMRSLDDPRNLKLYVPREERNWLNVNRVLTRILELGEVLVQFDSSKPGRTAESPLEGGGSGGDDTHKAASVSDDKQDLFDLLMRKPYFGPDDLGAAPVSGGAGGG
jgi:HEAT repeat protein